MSHYIIQTASAKMPNSCWGEYRRVAVIEVEDGVTSVAMISKRAKGVIRVVETWEGLNVGTTKRCAYERALSAARILVRELNEGWGPLVTLTKTLSDRNPGGN